MITSEKDMYPSVKSLLISQGFEVKGECRKVDALGVKGARGQEVVHAVEMKLTCNLKVLFQAFGNLQKKLCHYSSIAVCIPSGTGKGLKRKNAMKMAITLRQICRELGLGLIIVDESTNSASFTVEPKYKEITGKAKSFERLMREFHDRTGDQNVGGVTRVTLITAFKERSIRIARALLNNGPLSIRDICQISNVEQSSSILNGNKLEWFTRVQRGIYDLTPYGRNELMTTYASVVIAQEEAEQ